MFDNDSKVLEGTEEIEKMKRTGPDQGRYDLVMDPYFDFLLFFLNSNCLFK